MNFYQKNKLYVHLGVYIVIIFSVLEITTILFQVKEQSLERQKLITLIKQGDLEFQDYKIVTPNKEYQFLEYLSSANKTQGYLYSITTRIQGKKFKAWLVFDKNFQYKKFFIFSWEPPFKKTPFFNDETYEQIVKAFKSGYPVLIAQLEDPIDFSNNRQLIKDKSSLYLISSIQENLIALLLDIDSTVAVWKKTNQLSEFN